MLAHRLIGTPYLFTQLEFSFVLPSITQLELFFFFKSSPKGLRSISTKIALSRQLSQLVAVATVLVLFLASFFTLVSHCLSFFVVPR